MISLTVRSFQQNIQSRMAYLYVLNAVKIKCIGRHVVCLRPCCFLVYVKSLIFPCELTHCINWHSSVQNATNQPRLSPGRSTLPPAASWYDSSGSVPLSFFVYGENKNYVTDFLPFYVQGAS